MIEKEATTILTDTVSLIAYGSGLLSFIAIKVLARDDYILDRILSF